MEKESGETIELFNRSFKIVKPGLDINEVTEFIKGLISERDQVLKRQDNLAALTKLSEKTVIEAGELARQIEKDAREKVQKEANTILTQAHERAKVMVEQQKADAIANIQQQLKSIKSMLNTQVETSLKKERERLQSIIKETAKQVSDTVVSHANNLTFPSRDFEINLDTDIFRVGPTVTSDQTAGKTSGSTVVRVVKTVTPDQTAGKITGSTVVMSGPTVTPDQTAGKISANTVAKPNTADDSALDKNGKNNVEVEILSPRDQDKVSNIQHALITTPEIRHVELQTMADKSTLNVALIKPIDLLTLLQTFPEVNRAEWTTNNEHKKIIVTLR